MKQKCFSPEQEPPQRGKGVGAHARTVERHHSTLRQANHKIRAQVEEERLPLDGQQLLTLAVLAKNTLTT
eukprot:4972394-Prorocentrum_lima.AAC.1